MELKALLMLGCGLAWGCADGGGSGSDSGDGGAEAAAAGSLGAACDTLGRAGCNHALQCNQTFTDAELCTRGVVNRCCANDGRCDEAQTPEDAQAYATCTEDTETAECAPRGEAQPVPPSCAGLIGG
jgi:hypothetical protein